MDSLKAFAFGALVALAVGPIALLIIQRGIAFGARSAVPSAIGVALADLTYALVAFGAGAAMISYLRDYELYWRLFSALVLIAFGAYMLAAALKSAATLAQRKPLGVASMLSAAAGIYALTLANPLTILLFFAFAGQLNVGSVTDAVVHYALLVFLGSLVVQLFWALGGTAIGAWIRAASAVRMLNVLSYGTIIAFGVFDLLKAGIELNL